MGESIDVTASSKTNDLQSVLVPLDDLQCLRTDGASGAKNGNPLLPHPGWTQMSFVARAA